MCYPSNYEMCPTLQKHLWKHIRSFSGDTGYEPTPTANLISRDIAVRDDTAGTWVFPYGRDGYASTVALASSHAYFVGEQASSDWLWSYPNRTYIRILHLSYDGRVGYPIPAITS